MKKKVIALVSVLLLLCLALPMGAAARTLDEEGLPPEVQQIVDQYGFENVRVSEDNGYYSIEIVRSHPQTRDAFLYRVTREYADRWDIPDFIDHSFTMDFRLYTGRLHIIRFGVNYHTGIWDATFEGVMASR